MADLFKEAEDIIDSLQEGYDYQFSRPEREVIRSVNHGYSYNYHDRITWDFMNAIRLPEDAKAEFKAFEGKFGRLPSIAWDKKNGLFSPDIQKTAIRHDGGTKVLEKVSFSEATLDDLAASFNAALKIAREEDTIFENSVESKVAEVVGWCKDHSLDISAAVVGVACVAAASVKIANYFESTKDIREAVAHYVNQVEWDRTDYGHYHRGLGLSKGFTSTYVSGNKDFFKEIMSVVATAAKKNGTTIKAELYNYADKHGCNIVSDDDGVVTFEYAAPTGGHRKVTIDTRTRQTIGNATFIYPESAKNRKRH